jgi:hypothetical protein
MFGFNKPEDGSAIRFVERVDKFKELKRSTVIHHVWWVIHNAVAHPLIAFAPTKATFAFHDWTSRKINAE